MRDIGTFHHYSLAVPVNLRLGQVELPVFTGQFKAHYVAAGDGAQVAPDLGKGHFHAAIGLIDNVLEAGQFHGNARIDAVHALQGAEHHHIGHFLLLGRVHRYLVAQGFRADGPGLAQDFLRVQLVFHKEGTPAAIGIAVLIRSEEREDEGKFSPPLPAPHLHHGLLQLVVAMRLAHVGTALVPEDALGGIAHDGRHPAVPDEFRGLRPAVRLLLNRIQVSEFLLRKAGAVNDFAGHPGLNPAAAPGIDDDTHRHVQAFGQAFGKEIAHGRCPGRHGAVGVGPMGVYVLLRRGFLGGLDVKDTHLRGGFRGREDSLRCALNLLETKALDGHFHIGLAGANPHFAQGDIVHGQALLATFYAKGVGAAGLTGWEHYAPGAVIGHLGYGLDAVPGSGHLHFGTGRSPAPDRDGGFPLQHSVVGKQMGQLQRLRLKAQAHGQRTNKGGDS